MKTLTLKNKFQANATLLPNDFIDNYMIDANGEFVKVYLFLLRHLDDPCSSLTLSTIADCLNNTEKDILRAFRYWESAGLLRLEHDQEGRITGLELLRTVKSQRENTASSEEQPPAFGEDTAATAAAAAANRSVTDAEDLADTVTADTAPAAVSHRAPAPNTAAARTVTPAKAVPIDAFRAQKEIKSLLFIAEQYLGKTLTHSEMEAITYFYDTLHMSADLIEYLLETCVENGHKSMHYIQKVAFSWVEEGIETVSQAKEKSAVYNKNCYTVLNAFGIKNRGPATSELAFIRKWAEEYGFSPDILEEACRRTISATHQPSFEYADSILTKWHENNIRHLKDIITLDEAYRREHTSPRASGRTKSVTKNLNNFERRSYDMDSLEEQLLNSN